jgi:ferredoxin
MRDVDITFAREGLSGIVAVGTYLIDAAKRFGVKFEGDCDRGNDCHYCAVTIPVGESLLSPLTTAETEYFAANGRPAGERLACEARIIVSGEITIMTKQKEETETAEIPQDNFQEEFKALPLDKKISQLLRMEAITLGETFSYVINSPFQVLEKVGDLIADFGIKLETEAKKASRPAEPSDKVSDEESTDINPGKAEDDFVADMNDFETEAGNEHDVPRTESESSMTEADGENDTPGSQSEEFTTEKSDEYNAPDWDPHDNSAETDREHQTGTSRTAAGDSGEI